MLGYKVNDAPLLSTYFSRLALRIVVTKGVLASSIVFITHNPGNTLILTVDFNLVVVLRSLGPLLMCIFISFFFNAVMFILKYQILNLEIYFLPFPRKYEPNF